MRRTLRYIMNEKKEMLKKRNYCRKCDKVRTSFECVLSDNGHFLKCFDCGSSLVNATRSYGQQAAYAKSIGKSLDELKKHQAREKVRVLIDELDDIINSDEWNRLEEVEREQAINRLSSIIHPN